MVCVVKDLVGDFKSLVKVIAMLSTKLSYKLWHSDNRVSIVKLDSNIVTKVVKSAELSQMLFENIRHRSGGEEIFLLESEYLALFTVIVRVKHLRDVLSVIFSLYSTIIVSTVELSEVEILHALSLPKSECANVLSAKADNRHIIRHSINSLVAVFNDYLVIFASLRPRVAVLSPVVSFFLLEAVNYLLLEKAILVSYSVAVQRQVMSGGGIEEASGKSAKTTVAEGSVLYFFKVIKTSAVSLQKLVHLVSDTKAKEIVINGSAHKELHREIAGSAAVKVSLSAVLPIAVNKLHNISRQAFMELPRQSFFNARAKLLFQVFTKFAVKQFFVHWFFYPFWCFMYSIAFCTLLLSAQRMVLANIVCPSKKQTHGNNIMG